MPEVMPKADPSLEGRSALGGDPLDNCGTAFDTILTCPRVSGDRSAVNRFPSTVSSCATVKRYPIY